MDHQIYQYRAKRRSHCLITCGLRYQKYECQVSSWLGGAQRDPSESPNPEVLHLGREATYNPPGTNRQP
ncbi:hypothetical protein VTN49DRAFT_4321 [Thermomyces lanuginosus]|uniref:uncharacterized protein n=1 Tax=Thermomyces lanuginosus TaxID=5541 RepID=UPI0037424E22